MPERTPSYLMIAFLAVSTLLGSCGRAPDTVHILTDRKELATAVEIFGAAREDLVLTMHHVEMIDTVAIEEADPDLIIGSHLAVPEILRLLKPMSPSREDIYAALADRSDDPSQPLLRSLSFELPLIMGPKDAIEELPGVLTVQPEALRTAGREYNAVDAEGRLIRSGFSPSWDPLFYLDLLAVRDPFALAEGMDSLDRDRLAPVLDEAEAWIVEASGDVASDRAFINRYRYVPDDHLILAGRTRFARTDFASWVSLPGTVANRLGFRYLAGPRNIPVVSVVSAGIPRNGGADGPAEDFLSWLEEPETQDLLMDRWEKDGIVVFGWFGGLSAIPTVNETTLIDHYPSFNGMLPEAHYLAVSPTVPHRWKRIREEVAAPWFAAAVYGTGNTFSLAEAYRTWDLSSLAETD